MAETALAKRHLAYLRRGRYLVFDRAWQDRLVIQWAETLKDRKAAFRLVHDEYLRLGYLSAPTPSGMIYRLHHVLPTSSTLLLKDRDTVVGTLTHVLDTDLYRLPMDKLYGDELNALRRQGRRLAELSALAVRRDYCLQSLFMLLVRAAYEYALERRVTDFCIMVNPRHASFYRTFFLFEDLGPERLYPLVNAPAVALRADLLTFPERLQNLLGTLAKQQSVHTFLTHPWEEAIGWAKVYRRLTTPRPLSRREIHTLLSLEPAALDDLSSSQQHNISYLCPTPVRVH
uniref:N-acyl amino acid synthase FeeM catalytic core domain-containing protein n=1 Tax=Desulfacinum infernum TaxID=35837 RepID=A0A832EBQ8_9BACT